MIKKNWNGQKSGNPVSNLQNLKIVGVVALVTVILLFLWYTVQVLLLVFAGILLAASLYGSSDWISRKTSLAYGWSLTLLVFALLTVFIAVVSYVAPDMANQVYHLSQQLPQSLQRLEHSIQQYEWGRAILSQLDDEFTPSKEFMLAQATTVFSSTLNALTSLVVILFIGLYGAVEPQRYITGILQLTPIPQRQRIREVLHQVGRTLQRWLMGRIISIILVGLLTIPGLWLLGIPHALTLGLLAAVLTFIPYIGPVLSVVPAALLALLQGPLQVVYVFLLYLIIQATKNYILTPLIQERTIALPPVLTLTAQMLFGTLLGFFGVALATPLCAAVMVLVRMLYIEDMLGNSSHR